MRTSKDPIILWGRDTVVVNKVALMLKLKGLPFFYRQMGWHPRPELSETLGIGYRRVPLLGIGRDVYCDSALIARVLEERFPPDQGFPSLFPRNAAGASPDIGIHHLFSRLWADEFAWKALLTLSPNLPDGKSDRMLKFAHPDKSPEETRQSRPEVASLMCSHLVMLEEQLSDGREWMSSTPRPSFIDFSLHTYLSPMNDYPLLTDGVLNEIDCPNLISWIRRFKAWISVLESKAQPGKPIDEHEVVRKLAGGALLERRKPNSSSPLCEKELRRLKLNPRRLVAVTPSDTGRGFPVIGQLVWLCYREAVVKVEGKCAIPLHVHFPRIGYTISNVASTNSAL